MKKKCCICKKPLENKWGNNPDGAFINGKFESFKPKDRCCNKCNTEFVILGRVLKMYGIKENG